MEYVYEDMTYQEYRDNRPAHVINKRGSNEGYYNTRKNYIWNKYGITDNETVIYVLKYGSLYYVGSTDNFIVRRNTLEDYDHIFAIVGAGRILRKKVRLLVERDTIDFMRSLGYTLTNINVPIDREGA